MIFGGYVWVIVLKDEIFNEVGISGREAYGIEVDGVRAFLQDSQYIAC